MSQQSLEERVAALEQAVTELRGEGKPMSLHRDRQPMSPELEAAHREMEAYGRYYRLTGQDPPPGWKSGDPIPEADEEWCPR
jgi:hypothetical protein